MDHKELFQFIKLTPINLQKLNNTLKYTIFQQLKTRYKKDINSDTKTGDTKFIIIKIIHTLLLFRSSRC